MRLTELGWNPYFQSHFLAEATRGCTPARVIEESKGLYRVLAAEAEYLAQIAGKVRYQAHDAGDFPVVGDWVAITPRASERRAVIACILPRCTALSRKTAGRAAQEQVLAANLDTVLVVTSLNQEFNLRRLERYLTLAWESGAQPVVLLNKADLCPHADEIRCRLERVAPGVPVHVLSATTGCGLESVRQYFQTGQTGMTGAFIGSSGVGKSTIINTLLGRPTQRVQAVRSSDDRGRHTTTSRQMLLLPGGGVVVDTPGMRELQLWESDAGLALAFDDLEALGRECRFRDCRHSDEPGCAVARAVAEGRLEAERLENYRKMERELKYLETKTDGAALRAAKMRAKQGCKALKRYPKHWLF